MWRVDKIVDTVALLKGFCFQDGKVSPLLVLLRKSACI